MKRKLTWLAGWLCAALALGLVFWLRADGEKKGGDASEGSGPQVTKPYPRERDERERRTKNPREEFEAARKRGLTEEEVREVVVNFLEAVSYEDKVGQPVEAVLRDVWEKRLDVYFDALVDGFDLSQDQIWTLKSKEPALATHFVARTLLLASVDEAWEVKLPGEGDSAFEKNSTPTNLEQIETMVRHPMSFSDEILPWNLIELSEDQKQMVGYHDDAGEWIWVDGQNSTLDFGTTESYRDLIDPFVDDRTVMGMAGGIFPLSMWQVERLGDFEDEIVSPHTPKTINGGELDRAKFLTRPQLKTLLLFNPEMADKLMKELGE